MIKNIFAVAALLCASTAFAQSVTTGTNSNASQASTVNVVVGSGIAGSDGVTTAKQEYGGEYSMKSAPTVYAPNLTTGGIETCLGSVSGGASWMGGGVSIGGTKPDQECNVRMTANVAWKMGDKYLAVAIMCESDVYRKASAKMKVDQCALLDQKTASVQQQTYAVADPSDNKPVK
jgi:hypothetical protein